MAGDLQVKVANMSLVDQEIANLEAQLTAKKAEKLGLTKLNKEAGVTKLSAVVRDIQNNISLAQALCNEFGLEFSLDSTILYGLEFKGRGAEDWTSSGCYREDDYLKSGSWRTSSDSC